MKYKAGDRLVDPRDGTIGEIVSVSTVYPNDYCIKCDNNNRDWYSESEIEQRFIKIWPPEQYCCNNFRYLREQNFIAISALGSGYFIRMADEKYLTGDAKMICVPLYYCPFCGSETHPENAQLEPTDELEVERRR